MRTRFHGIKQDGNSVTSQVVPTPAGMSDTQFINKVIGAAKSYKNDLNYDLFPESTGGYNSNSYASGVLNAAGATAPRLRQVLPNGDTFKAPAIPLKTN